MTNTTYYNLNIVEGTDIVNPLTVDNPNYEKIDEEMHKNAVSGVTLATEIANATVHAINRENSECSVIRFIATSEWKAGDTATVDGVPVTALLPSGETLPNGAYVINANVLCILTGTNLTVYAERKKVDNADEIAYNNTTVAAELTSINSDLSEICKVYVGTTTERILEYGIDTAIAQITLPPGTYLLLGYSRVNVSIDSLYMLSMRHSVSGGPEGQLPSSVIRNISMRSGGGANSITTISISDPETVKLYIYSQYDGSTTVKNLGSFITAIKLS